MTNLILFMCILSWIMLWFEILIGRVSYYRSIFLFLAAAFIILNMTLIGLFATRGEEDLMYSLVLIIFFGGYFVLLTYLTFSFYEKYVEEQAGDVQKIFFEECAKYNISRKPTLKDWLNYRKLFQKSLDMYLVRNNLKFLRKHINEFLGRFENFDFDYALFHNINFEKLFEDLQKFEGTKFVENYALAFEKFKASHPNRYSRVKPWCVEMYAFLRRFPKQYAQMKME